MFACLFVPDFAVQAALLSEPGGTREGLKRSPIAVLDGPLNLLKVIALNDAARNLGIEAGMTKLQVETCGEYFCENALLTMKLQLKLLCWNVPALFPRVLSPRSQEQ